MSVVLGQDRAMDILRRALRADRMHHAWIFAGPPGVGKFTAAKELAKVLLDPALDGPAAAEALNTPLDTRTARRVDEEAHTDLHIVRKELTLYSSDRELRRKKQTNIPIDVLREHVIGGMVGETYHSAKAYLSPAEGNAKIFIIDEAELMAEAGQSSLLKTLEEPAAQTFIILVTTRPERLQSPVRSRCQHVQFATLDDAAMDVWFERANLDLDLMERPWIKEHAEGSPGWATLAATYGFCAWDRQLQPMLGQVEAGRFPEALGETMAALVDDFASRWVGAHKNASKEAANRAGAAHLLGLLAFHVRSRLRDEAGDREAARRATAVIEHIHDAEAQLAANVNMKMVFENLAAQWAQATAARAPAA